jgi:hypothetical protein
MVKGSRQIADVGIKARIGFVQGPAGGISRLKVLSAKQERCKSKRVFVVSKKAIKKKKKRKARKFVSTLGRPKLGKRKS